MTQIRFSNGTVVNFNGTPTERDIEEAARKLGIKPVQQTEKKGDGFVIGAIKDAAKTLVMKPAARLGQALGVPIARALGASEEGIGRALQEPLNIPTPLGDVNIEAQRGFGQGGGRQILGDAAKTTSYLYTGGGAGGAVQSGLRGQIFRGATQGAKIGAIGGGLYSFGDAVAEAEAQPPEVAYKTLFGVAVGGALGLTIGAATPIAVKTTTGIQKFRGLEEVNNKLYELNSTTLRPTPRQSQEWADIGVDPIKTYTEIFATDVPKVDKTNRFIPESTQEFAGKVDTLYKSGAEGFNTILRNSPETNSLAQLEQKALARNQASNLTAQQKLQAELKIAGEFQALRREYAGRLVDGDKLPVALSDTIKDRYWGATKYFGPEEASVSNEANRAIARSFAEDIEAVITDVNVKNYNKELQKLIILRDYLDSLGGKVAGTGGKMTRLMSRIVGGLVGSSGGPGGAIIGSITGDKVAQVLMNPENSPMRWLILKRLQQLPAVQRQTILNEADAIIQQMLQRKQQMLQLPAGAIQLGPRTGKSGAFSVPKTETNVVPTSPISSSVDDPLLAEARKYKSAEELTSVYGDIIQATEGKPVQIKRLSVDELKAKNAEDIMSPERVASRDRGSVEDVLSYYKGLDSIPEIPIVVENGRVLDGFHRLNKAVYEGKTDILVAEINKKGSPVTKSQLIDIWKKAQKSKSPR